MSTDPLPASPPLPPDEQGRADFYALIGRLLLAPTAPLLEALAAADPRLHTLPPSFPPNAAQNGLSLAWQTLVGAARQSGPEAVLHEHAALFDAVAQPLVDPRASRYQDSGAVGAPLIRLRGDLHALGLGRQRHAAHTEDHLGALCESMRLLVAGAPGLAPQPLDVQRRFFAAHIAPWADACLRQLHGAPGAHFHAALATLALAFFEAEGAAFELDDETPPEPAHAPHTRAVPICPVAAVAAVTAVAAGASVASGACAVAAA